MTHIGRESRPRQGREADINTCPVEALAGSLAHHWPWFQSCKGPEVPATKFEIQRA